MLKIINFIGIVKDGKILMKICEEDIFMGQLTYPSLEDFDLDAKTYEHENVDCRIALQKNGSMIDIRYKIKIYKIEVEVLKVDNLITNKNVDEIGFVWLEVSRIHTYNLSPIALKVFDKIL